MIGLSGNYLFNLALSKLTEAELSVSTGHHDASHEEFSVTIKTAEGWKRAMELLDEEDAELFKDQDR